MVVATALPEVRLSFDPSPCRALADPTVRLEFAMVAPSVVCDQAHAQTSGKGISGPPFSLRLGHTIEMPRYQVAVLIGSTAPEVPDSMRWRPTNRTDLHTCRRCRQRPLTVYDPLPVAASGFIMYRVCRTCYHIHPSPENRVRAIAADIKRAVVDVTALPSLPVFVPFVLPSMPECWYTVRPSNCRVMHMAPG